MRVGEGYGGGRVREDPDRDGLHLAGLDGLRAIAVAAVVLFHSDFRWARGGYLGVDLFFVISGFLITHLLSREIDETGGLNLLGFYWRRAKRLLPASWLMTAAAIVGAWLFAPDALLRLKTDAVASLLYVTNWQLLATHVSYFESIGRQPLLLHLWSLAIEEQFYILWAPILLIGLKMAGRGRLVLYAVIAIALLLAWTAYLAGFGGYLVRTTPTRLDFGTDTHSFPLLLGAVLGLIWKPRAGDRAEHADAGHAIFTFGLIALAVMTFLLTRMGEETPQLYPWGFLFTGVVSCALIAAATNHRSYFGRWLDQEPLRWIGERSYGIYLWHWPIFMLLRPEDVGFHPLATFAIRLVLTLILAALSYRYVETPIRQGLFERIGAGLRTRGHRLGALASGVMLVLVLVCLFLPLAVLWRANSAELALASAPPASPTKASAKPAATIRSATPAPPRVYSGDDVTVLGDSVLLGSAQALATELPGAKLIAHVGWQASDVLEELRKLEGQNALRRVVVVHLGTNGFVYEPQLRQMLHQLAGKDRVVIINTHVPRRWMDANNELFDRVLPEFPNAVLVDWRRASAAQKAYFIADGFHLTSAGRAAFISQVLHDGHLAPAQALQTQMTKASTRPTPERRTEIAN